MSEAAYERVLAWAGEQELELYPHQEALYDFAFRTPEGGLHVGEYKFPNHPVIPRKPLVFDDAPCVVTVDECHWFRPEKPDHQVRNLFWFFFTLIFFLFS